MINDHKVVVVLPAYNAARTLEKTYTDIPRDIVDEVVLVDDHSDDNTVDIAKRIGITHVISHKNNLGYGGNQKTCYRYALNLDADIVVMLHPDYQYTPTLIPTLVSLISSGLYPVVLGSRILGGGALRGGMPRYKYVANRLLTAIQNLLIGQKLSEYHTGYRAYTSTVLERINFEANSDDFVFDNQIISQIFMAGYEIAEVTCPTKYFEDASSINFGRGVRYGVGVLLVSFMHWINRRKLMKFEIYQNKRR
ncbi:glycosyltransferase family 2 protein [Gammaproteobacteria bacterium]|nr:glycosyltransferase family 2 protein [Gammaproteobacteria bacterium]